MLGVHRDEGWLEEGRHLVELLLAFTGSVDQCFITLSEEFEPEEVRSAFGSVDPTHDRFFSALNQWIAKRAPGSNNSGRKDPSRNGFGVLRVALDDCYKATVLKYLTLLGMTSYADRVADDGRTGEVERAFELAQTWCADTFEFACGFVSMGQRGSTENMAIYLNYCEQVRKENADASAAYNELQPYLNAFAPQ